MGIVEDGDIVKLLQNKEFVNQIIESALKEPKIVEDISSDVADKLSDVLEDDPEFRKNLISAVMKKGITEKSEFREKVIKQLVDDLS